MCRILIFLVCYKTNLNIKIYETIMLHDGLMIQEVLNLILSAFVDFSAHRLKTMLVPVTLYGMGMKVS